MAENKQPFDDDEFDTDEFDNFDEDIFDFDDEESTTLTEKDTDEETSEEEASDFSSDEADEAPLDDNQGMMGKFSEKINALKEESPKKLIKYALIAGVIILFAVGGFMRMMHSKTVTATPTLQTMTGLNTAASTNLSTPNHKTPALEIKPVQSSDTMGGVNDLKATSAVPVPADGGSMMNTTPISSPSTFNNSTPQNTAELSQIENDNMQLTKRVAELEATVNQLNMVVAQNQQMNVSNQTQLSGLIKSMTGMQSQMMRLNNALQTIVSAAKQSATNPGSGFISPEAGRGNAAPPQTNYYVQAIIPGRAWLKNASGQILTVGMGDSIPGYGVVTQIDAQNGVVLTSTGSKIMFGIDED